MTLTFWVTAWTDASRSECGEGIVVNDNLATATATSLSAVVARTVISAGTSTASTATLEVFITACCREAEEFGAFVARNGVHVASLDLVLNGGHALLFGGITSSHILVRDLFMLTTGGGGQQTL